MFGKVTGGCSEYYFPPKVPQERLAELVEADMPFVISPCSQVSIDPQVFHVLPGLQVLLA